MVKKNNPKSGNTSKDVDDIKSSDHKPNVSSASDDLGNITVKLTRSLISTRDLRQEKFKKTKWVTRNMAEDLSREAVIATTLKEAFFYSIFVVAVTISTIGRRNASKFYITQALKAQFITKEFTSYNGIDTTFGDITTTGDFWSYAESLLLDSLDWEQYYENPPPEARKEKKILYQNKLLGVPRIRQVRVKNDSCEINENFRHLFQACYGVYSLNVEERAPFGDRNGTAWTYSTADETKSVKNSGQILTYGAGGYYQDLSVDKAESLEIIQSLKEKLWLTRATRAVFIDFAIYNRNVNLFTICKLIFEFPATGGIVTSHSFLTVSLFKVAKWDYVTLVFEWLGYLMSSYWLIQELREMFFFKFRYFLQFWSYIDVAVITMSTAMLVVSQILFPNVHSTMKTIRKNPGKYGNMERIAEKSKWRVNLAAILLFFTYIKLFKYLNFNKTMGQLNLTLKRCAFDVFGFFLMFFSIFCAYGVLGYLLFGSQVEDFSTYGVAMFTLLRILLGDIDYNPIEIADPLLAPIYFVTFIFFVFFVLLNMFLAIINDSYADVKTEIAVEPDELQMTDYIKSLILKLLMKLGCSPKYFQQQKTEANPTLQQIKEILKKCGFNDLEIEMFFARYNVDPFAEVGKYDIKAIIKEWENRAAKETSEDDNLIHAGDFLEKEGRLQAIEENISLVSAKVERLTKKLSILENGNENQ